ncbi:hypothetical protein [Caldimonas sp. KR1-144]|uniref:hypothetical protein n=1 Tax=Caldimonas sp. KR1-144 TaxID=3400911 RepID=UPI003C0742B0
MHRRLPIELRMQARETGLASKLFGGTLVVFATFAAHAQTLSERLPDRPPDADAASQIGISCKHARKGPDFPSEALRRGISGVVRVETRIENGRPVDATILSGPSVYHGVVRRYVMAYDCSAHRNQGQLTVQQEFDFRVDPAPPSLLAPVTEDDHRLAGTVLGSIALDRSYADLAAEDRIAVRSLYEALPEDVVPPYPVGGPLAIYRVIGFARGLVRTTSKSLSMFVTIDEHGSATHVEVVGAAEPAMVEMVSGFVMKQQRFTPARCAGQPCTMQFPIRATFVRDTPASAGSMASDATLTPPAAPRP